MTPRFDLATVLSGEYLARYVTGFITTMELAVAAWILAFLLAVLLTVVRMAPFKPADWAVAAFVEYHRNVPLLIQILLWYFGVPELLPNSARMWINQQNSEFFFALVAIGLCFSAYMSEDLRSGIRSIPGTQYEAARALAFGYFRSMYYVILPQALRVSGPPLINQTLFLFKNTSLAMAIGVAELTYQAKEIESYTFKTFEAFFVATAVYLTISLGIMLLGDHAARRSQIDAR
ncbi:amino acid ABC transporter membrane protein 1 (PAAT family) [Stella humosa]|uniref:Amino acid ABC transporter membrane protein 1 (PAAT family) n=1 Tax=Stella humosa TaxID=94 RepID=A0A3N1MEY9_9PROT|nr:amino acid ABC transporter permease [Stella humosa]ROQ01735.1 amino acid ABC transporter membrane protein 1 (PAAT family) [Stella humosa]BBK32117.1 ABC transporter permease [Stella humosa]